MSGLFGAVLAGGGSRRFGSPKVAAELHGQTFLVRALRAVGPAVRALGVVGGDEAVPGGIPVRADARPGAGPLAGLETAFTWAREGGAEGLVALACDLPLVGSETMLALARAWRGSGDPARTAVIATGGGQRQPLCGIYGPELADGLTTRLDSGADRSVLGWLSALPDVIEVEVDERVLLNVNRPTDLEVARDGRPPGPPIVTVVGWKDSGKTTVAVRLVEAIRGRGLRVVALKHGHGFELDTPGTDSWRLRHEGGAARVVLAGPDAMAVFGEWGAEGEPGLREIANRFAGDADLVVAEGWKGERVPSVEVRRECEGDRPPLHDLRSPDRDRFLALVAEGEARPGEPLRLAPADAASWNRLAAEVVGRLLPDRGFTPGLSHDSGPR